MVSLTGLSLRCLYTGVHYELFCLNPLFLVDAVYREMKVRQLTVYSVPTHSEINSFSCHRNMSLETDLKISFKIMSLDPEFLVDCCQQI